MTGVDSFTTAVGVSGIWPAPPQFWSFSALEEVGTCPRRYALKRASYPELWDGQGYPERINESVLVGNIVHEAVETVLREFNRAGCSSLSEERAVDVLRCLGGYSKIATSALNKHLEKLSQNPRMLPQLDRLRQRLDRRLAEMRQSIKALVSQRPAVPQSPSTDTARTADPSGSARFGVGAHTEVTLIAKEARFIGRIDLLAVYPDYAAIVDFKTGARTDRHTRQLQLYGLLWLLDEAANPDHLPVASLALGYLNGSVAVELPDNWDVLQRELLEEISIADRLLRERHPPAVPTAECWHCPVRHLCDEYWQSAFVRREAQAIFTDAEVKVVKRNGPTSWVGTVGADNTEVLLRTTADDMVFPLGKSVRILDLVTGESEESDFLILTLTRSSEVFGPVRL